MAGRVFDQVGLIGRFGLRLRPVGRSLQIDLHDQVSAQAGFGFRGIALQHELSAAPALGCVCQGNPLGRIAQLERDLGLGGLLVFGEIRFWVIAAGWPNSIRPVPPAGIFTGVALVT